MWLRRERGNCHDARRDVYPVLSISKAGDLGRQYIEEGLPDYVLVWNLYDIRTNLRGDFLEGFAEGLSQAGAGDAATAYCTVLHDALEGNQFQTAKDLGTKHAAKALTNEQIQGTIHSSLGVSKGVALGWKAGYIKGFAAQRVADTAASASVGEKRIEQLRAEALATYNALRAAIGR